MSETLPTTTANTKIDLLFSRPEQIRRLSSMANLAIAHGAMASRLVAEERSLTIHPDGRRENVSEHSHMLAKVATEVAAEYYPWLDIGKVAMYSVLHDDVEAYVGDTPTHSHAKHDPSLKILREQYGEDVLTTEYGYDSPHYVEMLKTYEKQEEDEAQFVRIVDKIMVLLIHMPNEGAVLHAHYTYEEMISAGKAVEAKLLEQYPQWIELIGMRTSLSEYLAEKYLRDWTGPVQGRLPIEF